MLTSYDDVVMMLMFSTQLPRSSRPSRFRARLLCLMCAAGWLVVPRASDAAELDARTAAAYERHIAAVAHAFKERGSGEMFLEHGSPEAMDRMRRGEILVAAGTGDGIVDVPRGLIHHWRAAATRPTPSR
jgi:hypothetical protein